MLIVSIASFRDFGRLSADPAVIVLTSSFSASMQGPELVMFAECIGFLFGVAVIIELPSHPSIRIHQTNPLP